MAAKKLPPEYFLNRIREYQQKNGKPPRSNDFNGPFQKNIKQQFGSWEKAVDAALGVKLNHAHRTDAELLAEIKNFVAANNRIPNRTEIKHGAIIVARFGSYAIALENAIGFNPQTEALRALQLLTSNCLPPASLLEIASTVVLIGRPLTLNQLRGFVDNLTRLGLIEIWRGDRIALYKLTVKGKEELKAKGGSHAV